MSILLFLCLLLVFSQTRTFSHFSVLSDSNPYLLTYPLNYNDDSSTYQLTIGIQNGSSTISYFPMSLNTSTSFFSFIQNNISLNSSALANCTLSLYFSDITTLTNQSILLEIDENDYKSLSMDNYQGIFGMDLSSKENDSMTDFLTFRKILTEFQSLNLTNNTIFSVYLGSSPQRSNDSTITLGGYNSSLLSDDLVYFLDTLTGDSWSFDLLAMEVVYIEEKMVKGYVYSDLVTTIDIGTPNILLPLEMLNQYILICAQLYITCTIIASENSLFCVDEYTFISSTYPYVVFFFTSDLFLAVSPSNLLYDCVQTAKNLRSCYMRLGLSQKNSTIYLGQVFLKSTYTIFNFENNTIGVSFGNYTMDLTLDDDSSFTYTFYALLTIWGMTMVGCGIYFKVYLLRLNVMTNKITKIFYEKIRNEIRGNNQEIDIEDSEDSEENDPHENNNNLIVNNANNQNL